MDITNNELIYSTLQEFYGDKTNMDKLINIVVNKQLSLRIIDWFVTNYSKKYTSQYIIYKTPNNEATIYDKPENTLFKSMNVFHSYKCQLKSFSKKNFDPFCRRNRITFYCNNTNISTTLGQLNFFRWAIDNSVIEYILQNKEDIEKDMNKAYNSIKYNKKHKIGRKPRQELSISGSRGLNKHISPIKIVFD